MNENYQAIIDYIEEIAPEWQTRIGLDHWEIENVFLECYFSEKSEDNYEVTAHTECRPQYLAGKIYWYLPSAIRHTADVLEDVLVHEYCHVLLSPEQQTLSAVDLAAMFGANITDEQAQMIDNILSDRLELTTELVSRAIVKGWTIDE